MTKYQQLWWEQATSDYSVLLLLRKHQASPCQQLHYLQMVTEKLGKAYFWRSGIPPSKTHRSFVKFLQALCARSEPHRKRVALLLGFGRANDLANWTSTITPLAHELERLAPALAGDDGANPEYPWPRTAPEHSPARHEFAVWNRLQNSSRGRQLLNVIDRAVRLFPHYA